MKAVVHTRCHIHTHTYTCVRNTVQIDEAIVLRYTNRVRVSDDICRSIERFSLMMFLYATRRRAAVLWTMRLRDISHDIITLAGWGVRRRVALQGRLGAGLGVADWADCGPQFDSVRSLACFAIPNRRYAKMFAVHVVVVCCVFIGLAVGRS